MPSSQHLIVSVPGTGHTTVVRETSTVSVIEASSYLYRKVDRKWHSQVLQAIKLRQRGSIKLLSGEGESSSTFCTLRSWRALSERHACAHSSNFFGPGLGSRCPEAI